MASRGLYLEATNPDDLESVYGQIRRELNNKIVIRFSATQARAGVASFGLEYEGCAMVRMPRFPDSSSPNGWRPRDDTSVRSKRRPGETVESTLPASITTLKLLAAVGVGVGLLLLAFILFGVVPARMGPADGSTPLFRATHFSDASVLAQASLLQRLPLFRRLSTGPNKPPANERCSSTVDSCPRPGEYLASAG